MASYTNHTGYYSPNLQTKPVYKFLDVNLIHGGGYGKPPKVTIRFVDAASGALKAKTITYTGLTSPNWLNRPDLIDEYIKDRIAKTVASNGIHGEYTLANSEIRKCKEKIIDALKSYMKVDPQYALNAVSDKLHHGYDVIDDEDVLEHGMLNNASNDMIKVVWTFDGLAKNTAKGAIEAWFKGTNPNIKGSLSWGIRYDPNTKLSVKDYVNERVQRQMNRNPNYSFKDVEIAKAVDAIESAVDPKKSSNNTLSHGILNDAVNKRMKKTTFKDEAIASTYSPYDSVRSIAFEKNGDLDLAIVHLTSSKDKKADVWFGVILNNDLYGKSIEDKVRNCIDLSFKNRSGLNNINPKVISEIVSYIKNNYKGSSLNHCYVLREGEYLEHFGILGMKWGIRRYQNPDGSLTPAGQKRYAKHLVKLDKKVDPKNVTYSENGRNKFHKEVIDNNKDLKEFREKNYEESGLHSAQKDAVKTMGDISREAAEYAEKKIGKTYEQIAREQKNIYTPTKDKVDYINFSNEYVAQPEQKRRLKEAADRITQSERKFESEGYKFVEKFLGESSKMESRNSTAIKYVKDIGIKQQTIGERIVLEMYKSSGGRWNNDGDLSFETRQKMERELSPDGESRYDKYLKVRKNLLGY